MTKIEVEQLINQFIITNGNKEITAAILNPILNAILTQPNDLIGVLENSNVVGNTVVDKLNTLLSAINAISTIKIINGENNPNVTPPLSYNLGDFYNLTTAGVTQNFYQYNGVNWIEVRNAINDLGTNATQTWSSQKIANMINQKDEFTYVSSLSIDNNVVTIGAGTKWRINGVMYENINAVSLTAPYSGVGLSRIDNILGNTSNTFELQQGIQTNGIAFPPTKPENKVVLTDLLVTEFNINNDTKAYKEKSESGIITVVNSGIINALDLNSDASIIELTAASQLNSFNFTVNSAQYPGKEFTIVNKSNTNIELGYNLGAGSVKMYFPELTNYILKPKEVVTFYYSNELQQLIFRTSNIVSANIPEETPYNFTDFYRSVAPDFLTFLTGSTYRLNNSYPPIGLIDIGVHNILFYTPASAAYSGMTTGSIGQGKGFTTWGNFFLYEISYTDIYCQFGAFEIANHCYLEIDTNTLKFRVKSNKENVGFASPDSSYTASKGVMYSFIYNYVNENLVKIRVVNVLTNEIVYSYNLTTNIPPSYRFMNHGFRMNRLNNTQAGNDTLCMDSYGIAQKIPNFLKKYLL